jgi:hypothetical protein
VNKPIIDPTETTKRFRIDNWESRFLTFSSPAEKGCLGLIDRALDHFNLNPAIRSSPDLQGLCRTSRFSDRVPAEPSSAPPTGSKNLRNPKQGRPRKTNYSEL